MYNDAVLNENAKPVFNGTPEEVLAWLEVNDVPIGYQVCVGRTLEFLPATEYQERDRAARKKFSSPADARAFVAEVQYAIAHQGEEGLSDAQVANAKAEVLAAKQYLAECDEPLLPVGVLE